MSLWVLVIMLGSGTAAVTIDMPSKESCEREAKMVTKYQNVAKAFCVNRDVSEISR